jgi:hypothetical protein
MRPRPLGPRGVPLAVILLTAIAGCGGNTGASDFVESLVRLLNARFVPSSVNVPRGATRTVELEVTCDKAGLDTVFGRLGIRVKLDPLRTLPAGITATLVGAPAPDGEGFSLVPCNALHNDPNLRLAVLQVRIQAAVSTAPTTTSLLGLVEVEPLAGAPSKDSTRAELAINVPAGEGTAPTG